MTDHSLTTPVNWDEFCYEHLDLVYATIRSMLPGTSDRIEDLAQGFLAKLMSKQSTLQLPTSRSGLRRWLYTSIKRYMIDESRRTGSRPDLQAVEPAFELPDPEQTSPEEHAWADATYALTVLHLGLHRLRQHCESIGKPEIWVIYQTVILNGRLKGDEAGGWQEMSRRYPRLRHQDIHNRLVTANRFLSKVIPVIIPEQLSEGVCGAERLIEWKQILAQARVPDSRGLMAAIQIAPVPESVIGEINSQIMHVGDDLDLQVFSESLNDSNEEAEHQDELTVTTDVLRLLLSFRLSMPFADYLGGPYRHRRATIRSRGMDHGLVPETLLKLIDRRASEGYGGELAREASLSLLHRLKSVAKWSRAHPDPGLPEEIAVMLYNVAGALALLHHDESIGSLRDDQLIHNFRWSLEQNWLDDRLRPIFRGALAMLGAS